MNQPLAAPRDGHDPGLASRLARTPLGRSLRRSMAHAFAPCARWWIRYAPIPTGKAWLFRHFGWRPRRFTCRTAFGMRIRGSSTDLIQRFIYYFGVWEPDITRWMLSRLSPGDCMVDVGANVGYYSLLAASRVERVGSVVAIEASPAIHFLLKSNIKLNGLRNVRVVHAAAADQRGTLMVHPGSADNIGQTHTRDLAGDALGVPVTALPLTDILTADELERVRIVKIDVEGGEAAVVRGMQALLPRLPRHAEILIEISPELMRDPMPSMQFIFDTMRGAGYLAYALPNDLGWARYLSPRHSGPSLLAGLPAAQTDVLFSRELY
jgi:FkbM family methyltransferase